MAPTQHLVSSDGHMEGVQVGNRVVLFAVQGEVPVKGSIRYEIAGSGAVQHLLTNLHAAVKYAVRPESGDAVTLTASPQGTITFTTSAAGKQLIEVQPAPSDR